MNIVTPAELLAPGRPPNWMEVTSQPALIVDAREVRSVVELQSLKPWLALQPLPIMGITSTATVLDDSFDLIVASEEESQRLLQQIAGHVEAATVLVQVTRQARSATLRDALITESLGYAMLQSAADHRRWLAGRKEPRITPINAPLKITRDAASLHIHLNSSENRNALSIAMRDALAEAFKLALVDADIRRVEVRGEGPDFCAGGDLKEFGLTTDPAISHAVRQQRMPGQFVAMAPDKFHFHLHGACIGAGIEIPAFAGRVTAQPDTVFQLPELAFGLIPGAGGCVSVTRRIGAHRTNQLVLSGESINANQALEWGLIDAIENSENRKD